MLRIMNISGSINVADCVIFDHGTRLVAERIYPGCVIHVFRVVSDFVAFHVIVSHSAWLLVPAPAETDTCVGNITDFIIIDHDISYYASTDSYASPVFIGDIIQLIAGNAQTVADDSFISRIVWQMCLKSFRAEFTGKNTVSSNILKFAAVGTTSFYIFVEVESSACMMFERAVLKPYVFCTIYIYRSSRSADPSLIIQLMVTVSAFHLRLQLVSLCHIHTGLERGVAFNRRAQPCGIRETHAVECYVLNGIVGRSDGMHKSFHCRCFHIGMVHIFAFFRQIINLSCTIIEIPFTRFIHQLLCVGKIEGRIMTVIRYHRGWPRLHEVDMAFRLLKSDGGAVAHHFYRFHA